MDHVITIFFFEELPHCFPKWRYYFMFPPATREGSRSSSHSHFVDVQWYPTVTLIGIYQCHWPYFHVLVGCLYAFFGQMPIESVYVLVGLSFLLMNFKSSFWLADLYEVI